MPLIVPKVKKSKFNNIGVAEPKIGSQISEVTTIQGQYNKFVNELFRGLRLHFDRFVNDLMVSMYLLLNIFTKSVCKMRRVIIYTLLRPYHSSM